MLPIMKLLQLPLISLLLLLSTVAYSQTLKVTAVDGSTNDIYNQIAKRALGKTMNITVFDNSIKMKIGALPEEILKKSEDNFYVYVARDQPTEVETHTLKVNTTFSVITSAVFTLVIQEKDGQRRSGTATITAKRF